MPKNNDEIIFLEDREDPVAIRDGSDEEDDDDEEANEDLSLQILEKALSRRDSDDSKESSMSDLCGSGVVHTVMVNGGNSKSNKKMKITKLESANEISIVSNDQDEEVIMVEDVVKGEEDVETKPGETSSNLILKKLLRGARYFDPPDAGWVSCYSCGEQGHITVNCPTPTKRRKPCFICGSLEHGAKQCSKGQDCYICKKGGHRAKDCPDKYKSGSKSAVCLRCGDFGHEMILCKYEYSKDDLKDIQCYVCKSFGHLCCVEPGNSPSWAVSCYRCGQLGHIGLACGRHYEDTTEDNSASLCYRCGEEGHFSRDCPNSSSISTSQGRGSLSVCYNCSGVGHYARECPNSSQGSKRDRDWETSTPSRRSRKKNKEFSEHDSTPHETYGKAKKKDREIFEQNCTPHETNRKGKKKDKEISEQNSTLHETNGKSKKKDKDISEQNSTPQESNRKSKKKDKEISEPNSTPHESNGKSKKKKKKKTHKGEQSQTTPQKQKQRGGWITEDLEEESFQRGKVRRARSPITPSGRNYRNVPVTPPDHDYHRLPITPSGYNDRYPTTYVGHNRRSPAFSSGGNFSGSQSTTPYGRNHREFPLESSRHFSGPPPPRWPEPDDLPAPPRFYQPSRYAPATPRYYPPSRYAPLATRYGPARQYGEFAGNYDRY